MKKGSPWGAPEIFWQRRLRPPFFVAYQRLLTVASKRNLVILAL